jgi:hypothetical protein
MKNILPSPRKGFVALAARLTLVASLGLLACQRQAEPEPQLTTYAVSLAQAQQIAEHLANTNVAPAAGKLKTVRNHFVLSTGRQPALYVFNYAEGGFSIISADKHLMPVLAYSTTSAYANTNKPGGLLFWERKMTQAVAQAHTLTTAPDDITRREWLAALDATAIVRQTSQPQSNPTSRPAPDPEAPPTSTYSVIGPYLPVTWGQGCTYNELFPAGGYCNPHTPTGCVMTAMAQIMAYYRYPATYNWASMPANQGNAEVQRLMRDISFSLSRVIYQPLSTSAYAEDAAGGSGGNQGFRNSRFGYRYSSVQNYNYYTVESELQTSRPVILTGCDDANNCHMWIADGKENSCYFNPDGTGSCYARLHMNWGWHEQGTSVGGGAGGDYSGWFQYNDWTIVGAGQNGGNMRFQNANQMIVNIHP